MVEEEERNGKQDLNGHGSEHSKWPPLTRHNSAAPTLTPREYARYGRQMILPGYGLSTQEKLRSSHVLVIGAGGLGCPAIQYLSAVGVGHITVVDHDVVEASNLARQILHADARIGTPKVESIKSAVRDINPFVEVTAIQQAFTVQNALDLVRNHDVVVDCTDNPLTRYLINDAAVICGKTLVSGAGQGYEGQLVVLNYNGGPCYRCLFPVAPRPSEVKDCAETGVLGVVTGIVGTLQATETMKLLTGLGHEEDAKPTMLLVNPLESSGAFRSIKIRPRRATCDVCGDSPRITADSLKDEDYASFCGLNITSTPPPSQTRQVTVSELADNGTAPALLLDVRTEEEFSIVRLEGSVNLPWSEIRSDAGVAIQKVTDILKRTNSQANTVHVLCLKGNDSLLAADLLNGAGGLEFVDVKGGLREWRRVVDIDLPEY